MGTFSSLDSACLPPKREDGPQQKALEVCTAGLWGGAGAAGLKGPSESTELTALELGGESGQWGESPLPVSHFPLRQKCIRRSALPGSSLRLPAV